MKVKQIMQSVVSNLSGGLGNQMFQYAAARTLSLQLKVPLELDTSWFKGRYDRNFELNNFNIRGNVIDRRNFLPDNLFFLNNKYVRRFSKKRLGLPIFREKHFHFDPDLFRQLSPVYLDGYWQSELYFLPIKEKIRSEFSLSQSVSEDRQSIAEEIMEVQSVSVHVRRGDYASDPRTNAHHGTCSPEWYKLAIDKIAAHLEQPIFFVFSDDIQWARDNLTNKGPMRFIDPQSDSRHFEDMHLMAMCRHHIIANSSFSWWGAWLNPSVSKIVIAPKRWFVTQAHETRDLLPPAWLKL